MELSVQRDAHCVKIPRSQNRSVCRCRAGKAEVDPSAHHMAFLDMMLLLNFKAQGTGGRIWHRSQVWTTSHHVGSEAGALIAASLNCHRDLPQGGGIGWY